MNVETLRLLQSVAIIVALFFTLYCSPSAKFGQIERLN